MASEGLHLGFNVLVLALVLVVAVIILKKIQVARNKQSPGLTILSSLPLGMKEKVVWLKVDKINLLLGITATQISTLHVFEDGKSETKLPLTAATNAVVEISQLASDDRDKTLHESRMAAD